MEFEQNAEAVREVVIHLKNNLDDKTHQCLKKKFSDLCYFIESPLFARLCRIRRSLDQLGVLAKTYNIDSNDFDIDYRSGELKLFREISDAREPEEKNINLSEDNRESDVYRSEIRVLNNGTKEIEGGLSNGKTQKVTLRRGTSSSLGLHLTKYGECDINLNGIFVSAIQPGSIADKDGRLKPGDQVLSINEKLIEPSMSNEEILELLEKSNDAVELIVGKSSQVEDNREEGEEMVEIIPIHLINDGSGLGVGIVRRPGREGVMVKTVLPGSIAEKDGRLQSGDHFLQIESKIVKDLNTNEVASLLKHLGIDVRLTMGRYFRGSLQSKGSEGSFVLPAQNLDEILTSISSGSMTTIRRCEVCPDLSEDIEEDEYDVELIKDSLGLGLTINGYQAADGFTYIMVNDLSKNGVAARDGRIRVGDEILEVNGIPLRNTSNNEATSLLRDTGTHVRLRLLRKTSSISHGSHKSPVVEFRGRKVSQASEKNLHKQDSNGSDSSSDVDRKVLELMEFWKNIIGNDHEILVAKIIKPEKGSSLGITMDSRTWKTLDNNDEDYEEEEEEEKEGLDGEVKEYFHFLRDINQNGPVGKEGSLRPGDRLLQVDSQALINIPHNQVASIIRGLDTHICMVCARKKLEIQSTSLNAKMHDSNQADNVRFELQTQQIQEKISPRSLGQGESLHRLHQNLVVSTPSDVDKITAMHTVEYRGSSELPKSKETAAFFHGKQLINSNHNETSTLHTNYSQKYDIPSEETFVADLTNDSISSETLMELCGGGWCSNPIFVDLVKGNHGLGFSVVTYENPPNFVESSLLVRGLTSGGVAENDGRMKPGDKIISVNNFQILDSNPESAIAAIKNAPIGPIRIGILKPLLSQSSAEEGLSISPPRASFDSEAPPLSPPMKFSSKYIITNKNSNAHEDFLVNGHDQSLTRNEHQAEDGTTVQFENDFNMNKSTNSLHSGNLTTPPINSIENVSCQEVGRPCTPGGNVASLRKAFERNTEQIFQQHFPQASKRVAPHPNNEPRLVDVHREGNKGLGISIIGGSTATNRSAGVFIKNVFPDSPAGKPGKLRNGDRILEVNGMNCREATHGQVVEIIKSATNPIWFLVQNFNLSDPNEFGSSIYVNQLNPPPGKFRSKY